MAKIIGLPKLSPTMEEGTLVSWEKKEGDEVDIDDLLAEVETDTATMEFRSFDKGVLLKILVPEGETLAPDVPVAIIGKQGEDISDLLAKVGDGKAPSSGGAKDDEKSDESAEARSEDEGEKSAPDASESAPKGESSKDSSQAGSSQAGSSQAGQARASGGRILASPLVRKLAREHDLDLAQVDGSGPRGRIVKRDVEDYVSGKKQAPTPRATTGGAFERKPARVEKASQMRKTIARRLTESKRDVPHYYLTIDVDAEPILRARAEINAALEADGEKVSVNDLLIKAASVALRRVPEVNASWVDGEIHYHEVVDISVAVAIPDGLITPVVRDADRKGVLEIGREVKELASRAKAKKLQPEEFTGGTFSISNLGMFGIEHFTAVINPPEGAILAVGTVREEPVVKDGQLVAGKRLRMTMSCDHRVIDGALGAKWLAAFRRLVETPATMLV